MIKAKHIYRLMAFCLAVLCLPACSSDHDLPEEGGKEEVKAERYLHIKLQAPEQQSRTQVPDTPDNEYESNISEAKFYLVNEGHTQVYDLKTVVMTPIDETQDTWEGRTLIPEDILPGDYYLYIVVNPGSMITPNIDSYDKFIGEYAADDPSPAWNPDWFLMANTTNDISDQTEYDEHGGRLITIPAESDVETELFIERLAVKVEVDCADTDMSKVKGSKVHTKDGTDLTVTDVTIERTTLLNCVTKYNLIQHWSDDSALGGTTGNKETAWLVTPSSSTSYEVTDGNYYNRLLDGDTPGMTLAGIREGSWIDPNATTKQFMYCLENNPPSYKKEYPNESTPVPTKAKGRTTAVLIEAKIAVSDPNQLTEGTVYCHDGKLYASIDAMPEGAVDYQVYKDGKMYYTVWLKDDRYQAIDEVSKEPYHYYAVFRNSWNVLKINSIKGWGMDDPDQPGTDPIDDEIGLDTELRVNFWKIEHTEHTLGDDNVAP